MKIIPPGGAGGVGGDKVNAASDTGESVQPDFTANALGVVLVNSTNGPDTEYGIDAVVGVLPSSV